MVNIGDFALVRQMDYETSLPNKQDDDYSMLAAAIIVDFDLATDLRHFDEMCSTNFIKQKGFNAGFNAGFIVGFNAD